MKSHVFVDAARALVSAGKGGDGCCGFRREKFVPYGGPDGGDGGRGGHVFARADAHTDSLVALYYQPHQRAQPGGYGRGRQQHGADGDDLTLVVPCGTAIWDDATGERVGELLRPGDTVRLARGGKGGLGNCHWKTSTHQAPTEFTRGEPGEERTLRFELKLIADVGLIGFPNAGKSTLLGALTPAHPKVAPYPFTTLHPALGVLRFDPACELKLVDIPGLIAGAHAGAGLGHAFLRHVERTALLLYVLDMAGADGRNPTDDYLALRRELRLHQAGLSRRPSLIVANKMDAPEAAAHLAEFTRRTRRRPIPVCAVLGEGLPALKQALRALARQHKPGVA